MLLLLLTTVLTSFAQTVKVSMEDFDIAPGEQRVVDINVTNDVPYGTDLGGDIYLPAGLKIVPNEDGDYLTRNMTRCTSSHALTAATKAENSSLIEGQIRFSLVSQSGKTLKGNEGAVVSFTVEATDELAEDSKITLKDAFITNTSASNVVADCEANVHNSNYVRPVLTLSAQDFELTPTKQLNLSFAFATNREVSALQADITLPAGLEFVENEDGEYATFNMSRLTSSHTPSTTLNGNKLNIILSSTKSSNLKGEDGELFFVTLKATGDLAAESAITVDRIIASTSAGTRMNIEAIQVNVSNLDVAAKAVIDEAVAGLKTSLEQVKADLATYADGVQAMFNDKVEEAGNSIENIETAISTDVANGDVAANAETRNAEIAALAEVIAQIADDAKTAQENSLSNDGQYQNDLTAIADVQASLNVATTTVAGYDESVQAAFAETLSALQESVTDLTTTAEASHNNGTSVADAAALQESIAAVVANIEKLLADAAAAQQEYEEEVAKAAANEAQHTADLAAIAEVQTKLETATTTVAGYAESVQGAFAETVTTLEASVAALTTTAETSYNNGTSVADAAALQESIAAVVADIEKLLADAAAAQQAFEANEAQHTADLAAITEVQTKLDEVLKTIDGYSQSVQDAMAEAEAATQTSIDDLTAAAEASYAAGTSVADKETFDAAIAALNTQIANLAAAAEAAQNGYDANELQYKNDLAAIAEVQTKLETATTTVAGYAESVQGAFAETVTTLEASVAALTTTAETSYNNGTSVADAAALQESIAAVVADIEKLLADAAAAQQAFEANEAQHTADLAAITEVQTKLDEVLKTIDGYSQSVQDAMAEAEAATQTSIDDLTAAAEASYAAGTSVADKETFDAAIAALNTQIANLAAAAEAAQNGVDANDAQYKADLEAIAAVQASLDEVKQAIDGYDEPVQQAVAEEEAGVQEAVGALKTLADASYAAGTSVADKDNLQEEIAKVLQLIEKLSADAAAANGSYAENNAQHEADLAAIEALKEHFDDMKAVVETYAQDVQDEFVQDMTAIQESIDGLVAAADASFTAGTAVEDKETLLAGIAAVTENIDAVAAEAEKVWQAYQENEARYEADLAIIERVQNKFDAVLEKIAGFDETVAEVVAEDIETVRTAIDRLSSTAEKSHDNGTSVEDADLLQTMAYNVEALIAALDNKAELEQQKITTSISKVTQLNNGNVMFDLSGRQVKQGKGLVIIGKKKYVVK